MAAISWPAELPQRLAEAGFSRAYQDAVASSKPDKGVPRTRLQTTSAFEAVQCAIEIDLALQPRFRRFYREDTSNGSKPFLIPDQLMDGATLGTAAGSLLTTANGTPLMIRARWLVLFEPGRPPQDGDVRGRTVRISFSLLILP